MRGDVSCIKVGHGRKGLVVTFPKEKNFSLVTWGFPYPFHVLSFTYAWKEAIVS